MARIIDIKTLKKTDAVFNAAVDECAQVLREGGIVCIPTDSVYGFAAATPLAVEKICLLKGRPLTQKFPLLISNAADLQTYAQNTTPVAHTLAEVFWPGALTLVVEASDGVALEHMEEDGSVALRVPDSVFVQALVKKIGPLATTSANLHNKDAAVRLEDVDAVLLEAVDIVVDGGQTRDQKASTIVDVREGAGDSMHNKANYDQAVLTRKDELAGARILRLGSVTEQEIRRALHASIQ